LQPEILSAYALSTLPEPVKEGSEEFIIFFFHFLIQSLIIAKNVQQIMNIPF
jgi:hypothetical protein